MKLTRINPAFRSSHSGPVKSSVLRHGSKMKGERAQKGRVLPAEDFCLFSVPRVLGMLVLYH